MAGPMRSVDSIRRSTAAGGFVLALVASFILMGCGPSDSTLSRDATGHAATQPAPAESDGSPSDDQKPAVLLRTAMLPDKDPQPIRIHLAERRTTVGDTAGTFNHELDLELTGSLRRTDDVDGRITATLKLERIQLQLGLSDRPETMLTYDSTTDPPNQGNPLADVMAVVANAELTLELSPTGRLRRAAGLDHLWHKADILLAPPGLLAAQWIFRDLGMTELLSEALFPPMPGSPVRVGDAWEIVVPANVPLVARLDARVKSTLADLAPHGEAESQARIDATAEIRPAGDILPGAPPAIRPIVRSASCRVVQTIRPDTHELQQRGEQSVELLIQMVPPAGDQRLDMTLIRSRILTSERGRDARVAFAGNMTHPGSN